MSFIGNLAGSAIDNWFRYKGQKNAQAHDEHLAQQQANWNRQAAEEEYQRNLEHWHRANQYNDPKAQMKRLQEAGLNPNLVYGGSSGQTAGQASQGQIASKAQGYDRAQSRNIYEGQSAFGDFMRFSGELAGIKKAEAQVKTEEKKAENIAADTAMKDRANRQGDELYDSDVAGRKAENERKQEAAEQAKKLTDFLEFKYPKQKKIIEEELSQAEQITKNLKTDGEIKEAVKWWKEKRKSVYEETGIDIEKDPLWSRWLEGNFENLGDFLRQNLAQPMTGHTPDWLK